MSRASRRGVLGGLAALATPVVPPVARAASDPDAMLLAACAQCMSREAEVNAAYKAQCAAEEAGDKAEVGRLHLVQVALAGAGNKLLDVVIMTPALTLAGRLAKAEVAMTRVQTDRDGNALSEEDALIWSLAEDLAGKPLEARP